MSRLDVYSEKHGSKNSGGSRIILRRGLFPPVDNFGLSSQCIHSKKLWEGLRRGSMGATAVGGAGAPPDPLLAPPLCMVDGGGGSK